MAKVKIKPTYPDTPNWADLGWRYSVKTIELDFMEEFMIPSKALWYKGYPLESHTAQRYGHTYEGQGDMEENATTYRATRDSRLRFIDGYFDCLLKREPLNYENIDEDLWGDSENHERTRFQFPGKDGSMNFPEWRIVDSEYNIFIANHPYREAAVKVMFEATDVKDLVDEFFFDEVGYINENGVFNLDEELGIPYRDARYQYRKEYNEKFLYIANNAEWTTEQEDNFVQLETNYLAAKQAYLDGRVSLFDPSITLAEGEAKDLADFFKYGGEFSVLPSVKYEAELGAINGSAGQFILVQENGDLYTWIPELDNGGIIVGWVGYTELGENELLFERISNRNREKTKALNELILSLKPFTFSAHHMPAMRLFSEIQGVENRVIVDDYAAINAAMNAANANG